MLINQLRVLLGCLLNCADQFNCTAQYTGHFEMLQKLKRLINIHFKEQSQADYYASLLGLPLWKLNI
ncbi:MAG: hypothetical protein JKY70_22515 [Mucilaginibacter sp.]|nr:hypothetical protein [Mucilaginibacter sp.]